MNGKALVSGLNLVEMDARDMLDVVHFFFEEDNHYVSEEQSETRSGMRTRLYEELYGTVYPYKTSKSKSTSQGPNGRQYIPETADDSNIEFMTEAESLTPFNPREFPTKAYVPPTEFDPTADNPFGGILDAPLG